MPCSAIDMSYEVLVRGLELLARSEIQLAPRYKPAEVQVGSVLTVQAADQVRYIIGPVASESLDFRLLRDPHSSLQVANMQQGNGVTKILFSSGHRYDLHQTAFTLPPRVSFYTLPLARARISGRTLRIIDS